MAVETLSGIPCSIESGNTVIFEEGFSDFPASAWSATLFLSLNGTVNPTSWTASESGDTYTFTLTAANTAALAPGVWNYAIYATETATSQRATAKIGQIEVKPNLAASQSPSHAQAMVTALETVLQTFAATDKVSVSFNGQSFTRANVIQYREEWAFWKAQLQRELAIAARQRGESTQKIYAPRFS